MSELIRSGDVADRKDVGKAGAQEIVEHDRLVGLNAERFEPVAAEPCMAADSDNQFVEGDG